MQNISIKDITFKNSEYADILMSLEDKLHAIDKHIEIAKNLNVESSIQFWMKQKERTENTKERFKEIIRNIDKLVLW